MRLSTLFRIALVLIILGVVLSLASLALPQWPSISPDKLSAAGQIASAIATIFGISIAGLALFAYVSREEVGQSQADAAWVAKEALEQALHQFSVTLQWVGHAASAQSEFDADFAMQSVLLPAAATLLKDLDAARKSVLYRAISAESPFAAGGLLVILTSLLAWSIRSNQIHPALFRNLSELSTALRSVSKENVYRLVHQPLPSDAFDFVARAFVAEPTRPRSEQAANGRDA